MYTLPSPPPPNSPTSHLPFEDEVLSEIKWRNTNNEVSGNIPGENFLGGNFPGGSFPGGNSPGTDFPGGNFPRTIKKVNLLYMF